LFFAFLIIRKLIKGFVLLKNMNLDSALDAYIILRMAAIPQYVPFEPKGRSIS